jgi:hypothetical protein
MELIRGDEAGHVHPLSWNQRDLLIKMNQHPPCAEYYDNVSVYRVPAETDPESLRRALLMVWGRHEALRLAYSEVGSTGSVTVRADPGLAVPEVTRGRSEGEVLAEAHRFHFGVPLPDGVPLFRACVFSTPDGALLILALHHLIYDRWSLTLLWRDLSAALQMVRDDVADEERDRLTTPAPSALDFAVGQESAWENEGKAALAHWTKELAGYRTSGLAAVLQSADRAASYEATMRRFDLSAAASRGAVNLARAARTSVFNVELAASALALAAVTGQDDWLIGTDVANRQSPDDRETFGFLALTQATVARTKDCGVDVLAQNIAGSFADTRRFSSIAFERIAEHVDPPGIVKVVHRREERIGASLAGLEEMPIAADTWRYWRNFGWIWFSHGSTASHAMMYRTDVVPDDVIERLAIEVDRVLAG